MCGRRLNYCESSAEEITFFSFLKNIEDHKIGRLHKPSLILKSPIFVFSSVLEVEKSLVLAEKGSLEDNDNEVELLTAGKKFRILATMNPGGDFGKKEVKLCS